MAHINSNPRQHAHAFHLHRLLNESSNLSPLQRSAFFKLQIRIGEFTENAVKTKGARIPNVPAVFVERTFREKLKEIIDKIENGHFIIDTDIDNKSCCCIPTVERMETNIDYELSSDTAYQRIFDQFIDLDVEI